MAIPVIESSTTNHSDGTTNSLSLAEPTGLANDDLILVFICNDLANSSTDQFDATTNFPTGFTLSPFAESGGSFSDCHICCFWRIRTGAESWPISCPIASTNDACAFVLRVSGADTTTPILVVGTAANTSTPATVTEVDTTGTDDCLAFTVLCFDGGDGDAFGTASSGWTWQASIDSVTGGSSSTSIAGLGYGTKPMATAGVTGDCVVTAQVTDGAAAYQFAVAPGGGGGGGGSPWHYYSQQ